MNVWRNLHQFAPTESQSLSSDGPVPMRQSRPIEVDGVFLGAAVEHEFGVRFIAVVVRVTQMDQSIWPTLEYAYRSARHHSLKKCASPHVRDPRPRDRNSCDCTVDTFLLCAIVRFEKASTRSAGLRCDLRNLIATN
jgi:hypothetical protein